MHREIIWVPHGMVKGFTRHPASSDRICLCSVQIMVLAFIAFLSGCSSVEFRPVEGSSWKREAHAIVSRTAALSLEQATDCCGSLGELPYRDLSDGGLKSVSIDIDSPVHRFVSGKSFFAAYRVVDLPRPAYIELISFRSAEPGSVVQKLMPDARQAVFQPTILLLNEAFQVVRRLDASASRAECSQNWMEPAFSLPVLVSESPREVAYVVLLSSSESLSRHGQVVCGLLRDGMSPVGELQIRTRILPADDQPMRLALPVKWYPDARRHEDVGLWQFMVAEPRLLALGQRALHILEPDGARYRQVVSIPYESLVWVSVDDRKGRNLRSFSLAALPTGAVQGRAGALRYHAFEIEVQEADKTPGLLPLTDFLAAQIAPARVKQTVTWRVLPEAPVMIVEGGSVSRIGQAAMTGGMVTAFPCALCETGACTPEILGSCAALFGVGAMLGGTAGVVREIFPDSTMASDGSSAMASLAADEPVFSPERLERCLSAEIERSNQSPWQDSGLSARSVLASGPYVASEQERALGGGDYRSEVAVRQLALVHATDTKNAASADRWLLRIDAQINLIEGVSGRGLARNVSWLSETHPVAAWTQKNASLLSRVTTDGCEQLAHRLLEVAEKAWMGK